MNKLKSQKKILVVTASPITIISFLLPFLKKIADEFSVTVLCSRGNSDFYSNLPENVNYVALTIERDINPIKDLITFAKIVDHIFRNKYDLVYSVTPKAGLVTQLAAKILSVPKRVHMFTGQVWVTRTGIMRIILKIFDKLIAFCATNVLADSNSQLQFLISQKILSSSKIQIIGNGSICGVNTLRFSPDANVRKLVRNEYGYDDSSILALYLGRLNRDKGVLDLVHAFVEIQKEVPNLFLLIVGPDEDSLSSKINLISRYNSNIKIFGSTAHPEKFMVAADFFCLPSYREGFGSVIIEAAACGIPAVASRIYGLTDAVDEGKTGIMHEPGNILQIGEALKRMALNRDERLEMGNQAYIRAKALFNQNSLLEEQIAFIEKLTRGDY